MSEHRTVPRPPASGRTIAGPPPVPRLLDDRAGQTTPPGGFELDMSSLDEMGPKAAVIYLAGQLSELRAEVVRLESTTRSAAGHAEHGWQLAGTTAERISKLTEHVAALSSEVNNLAAGAYVMADRVRELAEATSAVRGELTAIYARLGSVERNAAAAHFAAQKSWQAATAARADITALNENVQRVLARDHERDAALAEAQRIAKEAKAEAEEAREAGEITGQRHWQYMEKRISEVDGLELERAKADLIVARAAAEERIRRERAETERQLAMADEAAKRAADERAYQTRRRNNVLKWIGIGVAAAGTAATLLARHYFGG